MFLVFEGIDGAGTTSVSKIIAQTLQNKGHPTLWTHEPSDGPIGKLMRQALMGDLPLDKRATLGLFIADRWWHVDQVIKPALAAGQIVVCDRYAYSTFCYQQDAWDPSILQTLMLDLLDPDLVFLLDCPVEAAQKRKSPEREMFDDIEAQKIYRQRYLDLMDTNSFRLGDEKFVPIDALKHDQDTVVQLALTAIAEVA